MVFVEDYDAKNKAYIYFQLLKNKQKQNKTKISVLIVPVGQDLHILH